MGKATYIKLFFDYLDAVEPLGDAEKGRLFTSLLEYAKTGVAPQLSGNERFLFPMMKAQVDRDMASYEELSDHRSKAGKQGGRPRGQEKANAFDEKQTKAKKANAFSESKKSYDKDNDKDEDKDEDKDKDKDKRIYERLRALYNETCVSFPRCISLSDKRRKALHARLQQYSLEDFKTLFAKAEASSFLKGGNRRNWTATFDWLIADANMVKVLDGNYDDRETTGGDWGLDFDRQDF